MATVSNSIRHAPRTGPPPDAAAELAPAPATCWHCRPQRAFRDRCQGGYARDIQLAAPEQLPELTDSMRKAGYAERDIRGILGENWLRVAGEVWK